MRKSRESGKVKKKFDVEHSSGNVFKDIGFDDEEAASLFVRAQLMSALYDLIESTNLSQRQIAKFMGVQQTRIAEIMSLKIQLFSIDLLVKLLSRLGKKVSVVIEDGPKQCESPSHKKRLGAKQQRVANELTTLSNLTESKIDLSEMPEELDWTGAAVGKYYRPIKKQSAKRRRKRT